MVGLGQLLAGTREALIHIWQNLQPWDPFLLHHYLWIGEKARKVVLVDSAYQGVAFLGRQCLLGAQVLLHRFSMLTIIIIVNGLEILGITLIEMLF